MILRILWFCTLSIAICSQSAAFADQEGLYNAFIANSGSDNAGCDATAPCVSLSVALRKIATGGKVSCINPPPPITLTNITISVTIECEADVHNQFTINLPSTDSQQAVHIKGLSFIGVDSQRAIQIQAAKTVILQNVIIKGQSAQGVLDARTSPGVLVIRDAIISQTQGPGVAVAGAAGNIATLDNVTLSGNGYGMAAATGNRVSVTRSSIVANTTAGVEADGGSLVIVDGSTINGNNVGIQSGSAIRLSNNNITFNATGVNGATGTYGNNRFAGNGSDGTALTPVPGGSTDLGQK